MTQKELLYVEDAIGHECNMTKVLDECVNMIEDEELKKFLKSESKKHTTIREKLMNCLEDAINE